MAGRRTLMRIALAAACAGLGAALYIGPAAAEGTSAFLERPIERRTGDLPDMQARHLIRVLVALNRTNFFFHGGQPRGFEYELLHRFEGDLNRDLPKRELHTRVVFIPVAFSRLIPALLAGEGDIAAAGLTITPERSNKVDFTQPYLTGVDEIIVTNGALAPLGSIESLAGRRVYVLGGSSYAEHLARLNRKFRVKGLGPIRIVEADEALATEDLLEMVNAGVLDMTVADDHIARVWATVLPNIVPRADLEIGTGGQIAWAVRKDNPELLTALNGFLKRHRKGTLFGNVVFKRYYENTRFIRNPLSGPELSKIDKVEDLFRRYADKYGFDWLAILAQAYQESGLDHGSRSPRGAVGIMQVMPRTAASPPVSIADIDSLENNVHAGVKYMSVLRDNYFSGPELTPEDRLAFVFAAYNAGPDRIRRIRDATATMGLDPDRWFGNVEVAALRSIGDETVRYVSNVQKYYVSYKLARDYFDRKAQKLNGLLPR